jgi:hypothetical protein
MLRCIPHYCLTCHPFTELSSAHVHNAAILRPSMQKIFHWTVCNNKHMSCYVGVLVHLRVTTPFSSVHAVKYIIPFSRFMAGVPSMPYSGSSEQATSAALAAVTPADALVKSVCHSGGLPGLSASKAYACAWRVTMKTTLKAAVGGLPGRPVSPGTYSGCKPERTPS